MKIVISIVELIIAVYFWICAHLFLYFSLSYFSPRQGFSVYQSWLFWNLLWRAGWPQTHWDPCAFNIKVLVLKACISPAWHVFSIFMLGCLTKASSILYFKEPSICISYSLCSFLFPFDLCLPDINDFFLSTELCFVLFFLKSYEIYHSVVHFKLFSFPNLVLTAVNLSINNAWLDSIAFTILYFSFLFLYIFDWKIFRISYSEHDFLPQTPILFPLYGV